MSKKRSAEDTQEQTQTKKARVDEEPAGQVFTLQLHDDWPAPDEELDLAVHDLPHRYKPVYHRYFASRVSFMHGFL